ncbi:hypothetical protein [Sphingorhabdus sp. Alg231-15]
MQRLARSNGNDQMNPLAVDRLPTQSGLDRAENLGATLDGLTFCG